jgi:PIN domain nuclease of toxin-antitoxin system
MRRVTNKYVVDAHALIWYLEGNSRLGAGARSALADPQNELFLPIIALAEACWIVEHGRSRVPSVAQLLSDVDADPRIALLPLDRATLDASLVLTAVGEMHDRQIVAAVLNLAATGQEVALLTRDETIRNSGLVSVIW